MNNISRKIIEELKYGIRIGDVVDLTKVHSTNVMCYARYYATVMKKRKDGTCILAINRSGEELIIPDFVVKQLRVRRGNIC